MEKIGNRNVDRNMNNYSFVPPKVELIYIWNQI